MRSGIDCTFRYFSFSQLLFGKIKDLLVRITEMGLCFIEAYWAILGSGVGKICLSTINLSILETKAFCHLTAKHTPHTLYLSRWPINLQSNVVL